LRPQAGPENKALHRPAATGPGAAEIPRALKEIIEIGAPGAALGPLTIDSDGKLYLGLGGGDIQVYESGRMTGVLRGHSICVERLAVSPDGLLYFGDLRGTIRAWQNGKCLAVLEGSAEAIWAMALAPNGNLYSSTYCDDQTIRVWRQYQCIAQLKSLSTEEPHNIGLVKWAITQIVFAKDGAMYTLECLEDSPPLMDVLSGKVLSNRIVVWRDDRPLKVLQGFP
jgi:WD40 repeat protein